MAQPDVTSPPSSDELEMGAAFHAAIQKLGFDPEVLCWALVGGERQLVMVTALADRVGPLSLYQTLFRAQEWGAIDRDFDLMQLSIYSPKSELGLDLESFLSAMVTAEGNVQFGGDASLINTGFQVGIIDPWVVLGSGIYRISRSGFSADQDLRRWKRFSRNVDRLAA